MLIQDVHVLMPVGYAIERVTATITRPADTTAYAVGDVIGTIPAALAQLTNVGRVTGGSGMILGARLRTSQSTCVAQVDLHLYNAADATTQADNDLMQALAANDGKRQGIIAMPGLATMGAGSDIAHAEDMTLRLPVRCADGQTSLWLALKTNTAFTPANAQTFRVDFWVLQV